MFQILHGSESHLRNTWRNYSFCLIHPLIIDCYCNWRVIDRNVSIPSSETCKMLFSSGYFAQSMVSMWRISCLLQDSSGEVNSIQHLAIGQCNIRYKTLLINSGSRYWISIPRSVWVCLVQFDLLTLFAEVVKLTIGPLGCSVQLTVQLVTWDIGVSRPWGKWEEKQKILKKKNWYDNRSSLVHNGLHVNDSYFVNSWDRSIKCCDAHTPRASNGTFILMTPEHLCNFHCPLASQSSYVYPRHDEYQILLGCYIWGVLYAVVFVSISRNPGLLQRSPGSVRLG